MKRENGITLISLVVTIVVMLILAGITIDATIGDNGLITSAEEQKERIKNDSVAAQAQVLLMKASEENEANINYNDLAEKMVQDKIIESYTVKDNGIIGVIPESSSKLVVCNLEVMVVKKGEQSNIVDGYKVTKKNTTPYSTLTFTAVQLKDGIKAIVLPDNTTIQCNNSLMATVTYEILETGTYTFKITDAKGKQTVQEVKVRSIKKDSIVLIPNKSDANSTDIIVEAIYPQYSNEYIKEISVDGGKNYSTYTNKITVSPNSEVKARVRKGNTIFVENSLII